MNLTAAELLRSVTRALASADPLAALPGTLVRDAEGVLGWEGDVLSLPVPGVGVLRVRTGPPDEALEAAAESLAAQIEMSRALQESSARRRAMLDVAFDSVVTMDADGVVLAANRAAERLFGYSAAEMVGRTVAELIVPPSLREAHRHGLARYLRTGRGPVVGRRVELTAMRADGSEFPVELVVTRPEVGGPTVFYGYLRDLTSRYVAEASLHRLADEQAALRRVATAVAAEHESARLFALVSEEVGRLLEARTAHMFRFDADGTGGAIIGGWALSPEHVLPPGTRMALDGDTAVTRVWRTGRAARMDSYENAEGTLAARMREYGVQAVVAAPVFLGGSLWGAVVVSSMDPEPFPEDAEQRISYFAELAAQALANAQAREELAASRARIVAAGDAERRRLERNLHDGAQQRLVSLALMLRLAARRHPDDARSRAGGRGALTGAAGAARARPRHPPGRADRARARAGGPRAGRPRAAPGRPRGLDRRRTPPRPRRGRRLLRRVRGADQRRQVRRGVARPRRRSNALDGERPHHRRRRRHRRRPPGPRLRPARPRRPRRGPQRPPHDRLPPRRRHHPPRHPPHHLNPT